MNYKIKLKRIKINSVSATVVNFDLFLNFRNNSDLKFIVSKQSYSAYINNRLVTSISNPASILVMPVSDNEVKLDVSLNPSKVFDTLKLNAIDILTKPDSVIIKVDVKLTVSLYGIPFNIPYIYQSTLKDMIASRQSVNN